MTRDQRYRYEMFVRVRDFGHQHRARFPAATRGAQMFAAMTAAVAAFDEFLRRRVIVRVEAGRLKKATCTEVIDYMKALSRTSRQVTRGEAVRNPFVMPVKRSMSALLAAARTFVDEARMRESAFIDFGMPPAFVGEFTRLVERLEMAVAVQNNGRSSRAQVQTAAETAIRDGMEAARALDVIVTNVVRDDPATLAQWRRARHIDGVRSTRVRRARTVDLDKAS